MDIEPTPVCRHQVFDAPPIKPIIHKRQSFAEVCSGSGKTHSYEAHQNQILAFVDEPNWIAYPKA